MEMEGRDSGSLAVARQVYVAVAASDAEASRIRDRALSGDRMSDVPIAQPAGERVVVGSYGAVAEKLREYAAAGATELCVIRYASDRGQHVDQLRAFRSEVVPQLA